MSKNAVDTDPDVGQTNADEDPGSTEPANTGLVKRIVKTLDPVGASARVLAVHRARLRYVTDRQTLLVHDGQRFGDYPHLTEGLALNVLTNVYREYEPGMLHVTEDGKIAEELDFTKFQAKLRTRGMIQQVLKLGRLDPTIHVKSSEFDANPYELNVRTGVLNLEALEFATHNPSQLVTKMAPVSWRPDAECPFWESFIDEITCHDKELAAYLQRKCGYCLSGSTKEEVMPILYGGGANGKSLYLGTLRNILGSGEYALTLGTGSILNSKYHGIRCDLRQLEGARVAFAIEVNQGQTLDEAVVKAITGGDEVSARALRQNPVQFVPQAKVLMAVNHLPGLVGNDHGIRRRIQVVPFRKKFDGSVSKEEIERKIIAEKDGIFAWMVRGFKDWQAQGLNPPEVVRKATEDYFRVNDHIGTYLSERTVKDLECSTEVKHLYEDYKIWADDAGVNAIGKQQFNDLIESRGLSRKPSNGKMRWYGIAIKHVS